MVKGRPIFAILEAERHKGSITQKNMHETVSIPAVQTICHLPVLLLFQLVKIRCIVIICS